MIWVFPTNIQGNINNNIYSYKFDFYLTHYYDRSYTPSNYSNLIYRNPIN